MNQYAVFAVTPSDMMDESYVKILIIG